MEMYWDKLTIFELESLKPSIYDILIDERINYLKTNKIKKNEKQVSKKTKK